MDYLFATGSLFFFWGGGEVNSFYFHCICVVAELLKKDNPGQMKLKVSAWLRTAKDHRENGNCFVHYMNCIFNNCILLKKAHTKTTRDSNRKTFLFIFIFL